ncbi:hypothetical protein Scep_026044 [Stephania cephalantha]|uniref:Uncharacterized protein n=1 Tax=Stephania cephalantha TaxID=152367 RepID=A0AAP0HSZ8_9MAGN
MCTPPNSIISTVVFQKWVSFSSSPLVVDPLCPQFMLSKSCLASPCPSSPCRASPTRPSPSNPLVRIIKFRSILIDTARCEAVVTREETGSDPLGDEGSNIAEHRERDLMIARGGSQGQAFESFEDSLGNEEREEVPVVEATEGHEPHEAAKEAEVGEVVKVAVVPNPQQMKKIKKKTDCSFTRWANRPESIVELHTSCCGCDMGQCGT